MRREDDEDDVSSHTFTRGTLFTGKRHTDLGQNEGFLDSHWYFGSRVGKMKEQRKTDQTIP